MHRCADQRWRIVSLLLAVALAVLALNACGGGGSSSNGTNEGSGAIEAELNEEVASAGKACTDAAGGIGGEGARKAAETACTSVQEALEKNVSNSASAANGSIEKAVAELAAECRSKASGMSFGKGAVEKLCDEIAELQGA